MSGAMSDSPRDGGNERISDRGTPMAAEWVPARAILPVQYATVGRHQRISPSPHGRDTCLLSLPASGDHETAPLSPTWG